MRIPHDGQVSVTTRSSWLRRISRAAAATSTATLWQTAQTYVARLSSWPA